MLLLASVSKMNETDKCACYCNHEKAYYAAKIYRKYLAGENELIN